MPAYISLDVDTQQDDLGTLRPLVVALALLLQEHVGVVDISVSERDDPDKYPGGIWREVRLKLTE